MTGTLLSFSVMAIAIRGLAGSLSILEILAVRAAVGLLIILAIMAVRPELRHTVKTASLRPAPAAQRRPFRLAISVGVEPAAVAARDGVRARIHDAGLDDPAGAILPRRAHDAEPHRRGHLRDRRRAGDPAAGAGHVPAGRPDGAGGGARLCDQHHRDQEADRHRLDLRDRVLDERDPACAGRGLCRRDVRRQDRLGPRARHPWASAPPDCSRITA